MANRQGPGGDAETEKAIGLAMMDRTAPLRIADIGCGTGASTLTLARLSNARLTAVDFLRDFLEVLDERAGNTGLSGRITTLACSMDNLPFRDEEYDVIWSEGAIYNIGFEKGVTDWNRYLKAGGLLVVSEITWLTASRPSELQKHWEGEYPEIDVCLLENWRIGEKRLFSDRLFRSAGALLARQFIIGLCGTNSRISPNRNGNSEEARAIVEAENREMELYEQYKTHYGYGVYIARKLC